MLFCSMDLECVTYNRDYGVQSVRLDRFGGEPSWLETAIREYEVGWRGPRHCCNGYCECICCARLQWLSSPDCGCVLKAGWHFALSLDDAVRKKWRKCRCQPPPRDYPAEHECKCLLLEDTEETDLHEDDLRPTMNMGFYSNCSVPSPESSGEPSGYMSPACVAIIERMLSDGWRLPPPGYDPFTRTWVSIEAEAAALADEGYSGLGLFPRLLTKVPP